MSSKSDLSIIENITINGQGKIVLQAFTGSGLVASISAHHLLEKLNLIEKGYISSKLIPSVGIVKNGVIQRPIRIFENDKYLMILSEIALPQENLSDFIENLFDWYNKIDPMSIVILGALPTGRKAEADDLNYSMVASDTMTQSVLTENGVWTTKQGVVYGTVALSLMEANKRGISCYAILPDCIASIPDYLAAKKLVELLNITLHENIPISPLDINSERLKEQLIKKQEFKKRNPQSKSNYTYYDDYDYDDEDDFDDDEDLNSYR